MKKAFIIAICVVCAVVIGSSVVISASSQKETVPVSDVKVSDMLAKADDDSLSDTLISILNHNFVYGADFESADKIVNLSMNALLKYKDDDGFIREDIVTDFVNNMYGINIVDLSSLNADFPNKQGYVFVVPSGYTDYEHSDIKIIYNEDGTITATTKVAVTDHDGFGETLTAETLFVPNQNSAFGYNIISSETISIGATA